MGVMQCGRKGCENIMCSTYIDNIGYVCYECQKEFERHMGADSFQWSEIRRNLQAFMASEKIGPDSEKVTTIDDFFSDHST